MFSGEMKFSFPTISILFALYFSHNIAIHFSILFSVSFSFSWFFIYDYNCTMIITKDKISGI